MKNAVIKKLLCVGNSQYVCVHAPYLRELGVQKRGEVLVSFEPGKVVITPAKRRARRKKKKAKA